jgi:nicotinic acid mononucleotide adenylyltransferase
MSADINVSIAENNAQVAIDATDNDHDTNPNDDNLSILSDPSQLKSNAPYSTGLPVLEIIRKLEDEKYLNRHDRAAFKAAFDDINKQDKILKALRDVELGTNKRFAIRRLRALIHQNGSGEISSKAANTQTLSAFQESTKQSSTKEFCLWKDDQPVVDLRPKESGSDGNEDEDGNDDSSKPSPVKYPKLAITKVVGENPLYADTGSQTICTKIAQRLKEFFLEYPANKIGLRKFAVIIGQGSFNPLTRMHMRTYFIAKQELESRHGYIILGSLLSPAHGVTVRERYRTHHVSEIIPSPHRLAMAQLMVQDSKWLTVDPWEITRRRPMDYLALLDHVFEALKQQFPEIEIRVVYLCKPNIVPKLSPDLLRTKQYICVTVCRAPESDNLRSSLGSKWNNLIHIIEDNAILDSTLDVVTSRGVREKIQRGEAIDTLVGDTVNNYVIIHRLGPKMMGSEEWTEEEKTMPVIASRAQMMNYDRKSLTAMFTAQSPSGKNSAETVTLSSTEQMIKGQIQQMINDSMKAPSLPKIISSKSKLASTSSSNMDASSLTALPALNQNRSSKILTTSVQISIPTAAVDTTTAVSSPPTQTSAAGSFTPSKGGVLSKQASPTKSPVSASKMFTKSPSASKKDQPTSPTKQSSS